MLKITLSNLIIILSIMMYFMNNPLPMGFLLLTQTMLTCLITGLMMNTYWFSYILFMILIGGLLVMFMYVSSISSNELFYMPLNNFIKMNILMIIIIMMMIMMYKNNQNLKFLNLLFNQEMNNFLNEFSFFNNENKLNLCKLYNNQTYPMMIMMIVYLFITLLMAVKISNSYQGPLRT